MKALKFIFILLLGMVIIYLPFVVAGGSFDVFMWVTIVRQAYCAVVVITWACIAGISISEDKKNDDDHR